jgi:hypothetical protein
MIKFKNIGTADRAVRIIAGAAMIGLGWAYQSRFGLLGLVPFLTAGVEVCPLYLPFGLSTRKGA